MRSQPTFSGLFLVLCGCQAARPSALEPANSLPVLTLHSAATTPTPVDPRAAFRNPGGLWLPEQMPGHAQVLKDLGLLVDPKLLSDPLSGLLGAIVRLSGCSASFISADGLIATNHGKPADYDAANAPYRPTQHLALATRPLVENDLAITRSSASPCSIGGLRARFRAARIP